MIKVMSDLEQRIRRACKILFKDRDRMLKEIAEIKARLEELEQRLSSLYKMEDN